MRVIGLTGGIGMGKSTIAAALRRAGLPVGPGEMLAAQQALKGGAAVRAIGAAFPGTVRGGVIDRDRLRRAVIGNPGAMRRLEAIMHPLVRRAERAFLARARRRGHAWAVLDIPLLFETGGTARVDRVLVVSAPPAVQMARVRARGRMSDGQIRAIIARQTPDRVKRRGADQVIETGLSRWHALRALRRWLARLDQDRTLRSRRGAGRGRPVRLSRSGAGHP
jgi:dephospho-CoA kinase